VACIRDNTNVSDTYGQGAAFRAGDHQTRHTARPKSKDFASFGKDKEIRGTPSALENQGGPSHREGKVVSDIPEPVMRSAALQNKQSVDSPIRSRDQWLVLVAAFLGWMFDGVEQGVFP
jgi:hypothetical protein